ncbi:class III signal peptide-containing protein [Methanococcus voltae]|uniref:class III signal peptide-containing protein n=1 Tax=Methanococcus voltae TaxID=2188 RepID=UPI001AE3CE66|nr:class III signal peptide-containing protein [Methanococcus voltae]
MKKLKSTKGQISMEVGILIAAAVAVAAVAGYFYLTNVKNVSGDVGNTASGVIDEFTDAANNAGANNTTA